MSSKTTRKSAAVAPAKTPTLVAPPGSVGAGTQPGADSPSAPGSAPAPIDSKINPASEAGVSDGPDCGEPRPDALLRVCREDIQKGAADIDLLGGIARYLARHGDLATEQDVRVHASAVQSGVPEEIVQAVCVADPTISHVLSAKAYDDKLVLVVMSDARCWKVVVR